MISGSPNVLIDGKPVARVGDQLAPHSKPKHPPHPRAIASGSSTVFINGLPVAITGGEISCGGVTIGGGSVVVGDTHTPVPIGVRRMPAFPPGLNLASNSAKRVVHLSAYHEIRKNFPLSCVLDANGDIHVQERRRTRKELAIYNLHRMHEFAVASGVPVDVLNRFNPDHALPDSLQSAIASTSSTSVRSLRVSGRCSITSQHKP